MGTKRIFINADLSQIQARTVAHMSDDHETIKLFDTCDIHALTASVFFGGTVEQHSKKPDGTEPVTRFCGKTVRYAGLYGAQKRRIMLTVNTDARKYGIDYSISEYKAGILLEKYHEMTPKIKGVYFERIKEIARNGQRILISPFGRRVQYYGRYDDDLIRQMAACIPQGIDHDHLCQSIMRVQEAIDYDPDLKLHVEAHDGALFSATEGREFEFGKLIKFEMEKEIDFAGCSIPCGKISIPTEIKVGYNYANLKKIKFQ